MSKAIATSVVVVSRGRPDSLCRTLYSLMQQDHPNLEVVVVADAAGHGAVDALPFAPCLKRCRFDDAGISRARNLGIALAAGDVIAFIDDDAVAEPTWARRLSAPFRAAQVSAATGFVRGRNGISYQWRASAVARDGREAPLDVPPGDSLHGPSPGHAIKTVGTNCAFRRTALIAVGGFDPRFRYFLDETDLNLRLARSGGVTAIVTDAQVHHGFAANETRRADRTPTDLFEIGASVSMFLARHCPEANRPEALARFRTEQHDRAYRYLDRTGHEAVAALLDSFDRGVVDGPSRGGVPSLQSASPPPFLRLRGDAPVPRHVVLAGRTWSAASLRRQARDLAGLETVVSLFIFAPTPRAHTVRYHAPGYWEQSGGVFGRSCRCQRRVQWATFRLRLKQERNRIAPFRIAGAM